MSDYIVSARKYRPDTFESLIGQDNISKTLKNSILRGQLAHAYLFCGPRGVGKTSAARIFAKTINCSNPGPDLSPCGECESCKSFREGRSYCIHELDAASNNGVDDIKALMDQVQIPPQTGRYSVYIIDEVHMLSASAFNAFLKTLEEPPAHAIFILATTEKHKILPTILSRCQTYDFNRISVQDIMRNLREIATKENIGIDDESLHVIAHKADGAMRDALTIFDQTVAFCGIDVKYEEVLRNLNVLDYEYSFRLVDAFLSGDYATALLIFDEVLAKGFNALYFVSSLGSHLRDLLVSGTGGLEALIDFPQSLRLRYADQASKCSIKFLYDALSICSQCEAGYRASSNQRLHIEFSLMKIAFLSKAPAGSAAQIVGSAQSSTVVAAPSVQVTAAAVQTATATQVPTKPTQSAVPTEKKAVKSAASLSLSSLMGAKSQTAKQETAQTAHTSPVAMQDLPSEERLFGLWKELSAMYSSQPRLSNALSSAKLELAEEDGRKLLYFSVTNESQKKWIEERILRELEARFCKLVGGNMIRLEPRIIAEEAQEVKKYMPAEKAEELMKINPEVRSLVADLALDVK